MARPNAVLHAVLVEGRVVTTAGLAAAPYPPLAGGYAQPIHPATLDLSDEDLAWLAVDPVARAAAA